MLTAWLRVRAVCFMLTNQTVQRVTITLGPVCSTQPFYYSTGVIKHVSQLWGFIRLVVYIVSRSGFGVLPISLLLRLYRFARWGLFGLVSPSRFSSFGYPTRYQLFVGGWSGQTFRSRLGWLSQNSRPVSSASVSPVRVQTRVPVRLRGWVGLVAILL